jgi:molecular chaperone DnaJ
VPTSTDYYEVLGVPRDADADSIKKAFRSRARDVHPDTSEHDDAEERFKVLNEAYEVLSDPEKRANYDRFGTADPRQAGGYGGGFEDLFGGGGMGDMFSVIFDGVMGGGGRTMRREGRDMAAQVDVTLLEAADGVTKEVRYTRTATCETCGGSGAGEGATPQTCPTCNGAGQVRAARRTMLGIFESVQQCDRCGGAGTIVEPPCPTCTGGGRVSRVETVSVGIPAGVFDGGRLRVQGMGEAGFRGAPAGDLIVGVHVRAHEFLHREGDDLHARANVLMTTAALGGEITVPGLRGDVTVKVPSHAQNGDTVTVRGEGMPRSHGASSGDLTLHLNIVVPKRLSKEQRALLETLSESFGGDHRGAASPLDKLRDWLGV